MTELTDMARTPEDMAREMMPMAGSPGANPYPYGLSISLTHTELTKLGLTADCEVGDTVHLTAVAKVTSVSSNASESSESCRIELQITQLAVEDESPSTESRANKRYGKDAAEESDAGDDA